MKLIDTHTHINSTEFDADRQEIIDRAISAGVAAFIDVGVDRGLVGAKRSLELSAKYPFIYSTIGVHPHDAKEKIDYDEFLTLAQNNKTVAIGEMGLDFHYNFSDPRVQEESFRLQIQIAKQVKKPIVIHSREAGEKVFEILKEENAKDVGGVFHCFAENLEFAKRLSEINFIISIPGVVTYKKSEILKEVVKGMLLESIMLETDAPYLSPVPYRGKRCEPAYIVETARCLAELKNVSLEEVANITTENAKKLFGISIN